MKHAVKNTILAILILALTTLGTSAANPQGNDPPADYMVLNLEEDISTTAVAQSGSMVVFDFTVTCVLEPGTIDIWFDLLLPDGQEIGPYYIWWDVPMTPGETGYKNCMLYISPMCMPGEYTVLGRCGDHFPLVIDDEDSFTFEKATGQLSGGAPPTPGSPMAPGGAASLITTSGSDEPALQSVSLSPQPCNPEVNLSFVMQQAGAATVSIYNVQGRKLLERNYTQLQSGYHAVTIPTQEIPSGCYILNIEANGTAIQQRMTILK
ncbi:T9SS type A sorting domain-containing protein [bacterium]|nr:T9SS type A sorting domain-containing protein [bacterium]MBU1651787.1 T9SS type A sorting domain-containing protein [bacterium]MBU1882259.1 T9SS type A sorting domain-containing protein [bacterium]